MSLTTPRRAEHDPLAWVALPYPERVRLACIDWAVNGFGAPVLVYGFYLAKIALYIGVWLAFAAATPGLGGLRTISSWWAEPIAFQKAILWTMLYEGLGLGAGSGPLTGRYWPPISGLLHFLRPGTTRLPAFRGVPLTAGHRRTVADVLLYAAHVALVLRALAAPTLGAAELAPIVILLPLLGLRDKTIFLASRGEHYWTTTVVFLFAGDVIAGSQAVQLAIWWWAATSKLNRHFPAVIAVMLSNNAWLRWRAFRRRLYRGWPTDLRPSGLATGIAHAGTVVEYGFPLLLISGRGGALTTVGLIVMVAFHLNILTSIPIGVPLEWNVLFIYSGLALFGAHAEVRPWDVQSPLLAALLIVALIVLPAVGNLAPARVSFLVSMRYYAGNWGYSMWLFRPEALARLDGLTTSSRELLAQVRRLFDEDVVRTLQSRLTAFRAMHLHGRALQELLPRALADTGDLEEREIRDGEIVAGLVLGWNFGDLHLHDERLLAAVQAQCAFAPGDLRCVIVEAQPMGRRTLAWRIVDAADGRLDAGVVAIDDLADRQPWPEPASAAGNAGERAP